MKIMLTGAGGQLGRCLTTTANQGQLPAGWVLHDLSRQQLDIRDAVAVNSAVARLRPDVVINAAAWTDVDAAQEHAEQVMATNALGAAHVAAAAAQAGARLFHLSTDYVFDGTARVPIDETVRPSPLNVYGASKLAGERAVRDQAPDAVVVRTSWLYSVYGKNFVKTILKRGVRHRVLDVVDDQMGSPTLAADLASAILHLVQRPGLPGGLYHYAGNEAMTWFEFACNIVDCAARHDAAWADVRVQAISTRDLSLTAPRPAYTVLSCEKIKAAGVLLHGPRERLEQVVRAILTA